MPTDLKASLLDEIALEGLDGITVNSLWIRLKGRSGFSLNLDEKSKAYLWRCVLGLEDLAFYELSKPRADLIPYDRFHYVDPETKHFLETNRLEEMICLEETIRDDSKEWSQYKEDIPEDIYPVNVIIEQPVKGSCVEYSTRKEITEDILTDKPMLSTVIDRYGNKLVIVASPTDRLRSLIGPENDPDFQLSDLSYCILERIGRSRYCGEVAAGKHSLHLLVENSKTLFYQMKKLNSLAVIKKQRMCTIRKPQNVKVTVSLFHLTRFSQPVISKTKTEIVSLAKLLSSKPEQMEVVATAKQTLRSFDKVFKKVAQATNAAGERFFEFIDIPYRELHPDATPKEYLWKNGKGERTIRHVRLLKPLKEVETKTEIVDSSDDEEDETVDDNAPKVVLRREFDKPYMYQAMEVIRETGPRGLSQNELKRILGTTKLGVRRICKFLHRLKYLTTVLMNKGRQKEVMYVAVENLKDNKIHKSVEVERQKFGDIIVEEYETGSHRARRVKKKEKDNTGHEIDSPVAESSNSGRKEEEDKFKLNDEKPTEQKISAIKEELNRLEEMSQQLIKPPSQAKIEVIREMTEDGTLVKVRIEEMTMMGPEHVKAGTEDSLGLKRFRKLLTDVHIRRANWITEVVTAVKVLENFKLLRLLRTREEALSLPYMMDARSLKRLITALVQEKKIRCYAVWITMGDREKRFQYLCDPSVNRQDQEMMRSIEQAKLRYFSVSKEELKKKSKMLAPPPASPIKHVQLTDLNIPETAKASILKHQQYRQKLRTKSSNMKYDRKAGLRYGLLPKMLRINTTHQLLWHVCYETYGHELMEDKDKERTHTTEAAEMDTGTGTSGELQSDLDNSSGTTKRKVQELDDEETERNSKRVKLQSSQHEKPKEKLEQDVDRDEIVMSEKSVAAIQDNPDDTENSGGNDKKADSNVDATPEKENQKSGPDEPVNLWPQKEPHVYVDDFTWQRYMPPVPLHIGYPRGWCLISDILLNLPVCLFCQLVNVCYDVKGLVEILDDPDKRLYPLNKLPFSIAQQLLHSKKYVQCFFDTCVYLCEMGLLSFGQEMLKDKDQTFVYLHRKASLLDTRESQHGYNKTKPPEGMEFPSKTYRIDCMSDVLAYWEDFQIIALGSNLGYKSFVTANQEDTDDFCVRSLKEAADAVTPNTIKDDGVVPGDRRGAAGIDSGMFVYTMKNWSFSSISNTSISDKQYNKIKIPTHSDIVGKRKIYTPRLKGRERLLLSENPDTPIQIKKVIREGGKGNRGGKGIKKTTGQIPSLTGRMKQKHRKGIKMGALSKAERKKPWEKGDEKDKAIYAERRKQRVIWTAKEDSVLLMCWLACLLMDKNRRVTIVNYKVLRDFMHDTVGKVALDKTSIACARRLKFVLKNPQTEANLLLFYREGSQDPYIKKEFVEKVFVNTDKDVVPKFKELTGLLLNKFQSLNLQKSALPETLSELPHYRIDLINNLHSAKDYRDVTCKEHVCHDVLRNILHSAVLLQDKQGRTHEMFKLLTQYPDPLLNSVIKELRKDGLFVIQKKNYTKTSINQLHSGVGLRNFKVSQRYMYNYKHRNLSTLFEDSADFLDMLCNKYVENDGEDQSVVLDFQPKGGQAAIMIPLVLRNKLDITLTLPQELVVVDMEGFYSFPWGRGKHASHGSAKSDKSLQEMLKSKAAINKEKGKAGKQVGKDFEMDKDDIDDDEEENLNTEKGVNQDIRPGSVEIESPAVETRSSQDREGTAGTDDGNSKAKASEDKESTVAGPEDKKPTSSGKTFALVGKTIEEIKRNLSSEGSVTNADNTGTALEYVCTKNGSSTFIVPKFEETVTGVVPMGVTGIASRTLLSLRRAEGVSFEDIRVFNAQDNFVVNSCKIKVKLKDNKDEDDENINKTVEVVSDNPDELKPFADSESEKKRTYEEKLALVNSVKLDKKKADNTWAELQRLLPFQIDMAEVWESLRLTGLSEEDLSLYKQVYAHIDSNDVLGVRGRDLQKHFHDVLPLKDIVKVLQTYAAKLKSAIMLFSSLDERSFVALKEAKKKQIVNAHSFSRKT